MLYFKVIPNILEFSIYNISELITCESWTYFSLSKLSQNKIVFITPPFIKIDFKSEFLGSVKSFFCNGVGFSYKGMFSQKGKLRELNSTEIKHYLKLSFKHNLYSNHFKHNLRNTTFIIYITYFQTSFFKTLKKIPSTAKKYYWEKFVRRTFSNIA